MVDVINLHIPRRSVIVTKIGKDRPGRVTKVTARYMGEKLTIPAEHYLSSTANHTMAARLLAHRLGWNGNLAMGEGYSKDTNVFVFV
jgi:hypothetical protein